MKWKLFSVLLWISFGASAHQPDISTAMLIEQDGGKWILQINSSLTALQYEVSTHFGDDAYSTPEEFQRLVNQYMRETILLVFNTRDTASISNSYVKLGHASSVILELKEVPAEVREVAVRIESFRDINRNQCAFGIVKEGISSEQVLLSNAHAHEAQLIIDDGKFVSKPEQVTLGITRYHYLSFAVITGALVVFGFRRLYPKRIVSYS